MMWRAAIMSLLLCAGVSSLALAQGKEADSTPKPPATAHDSHAVSKHPCHKEKAYTLVMNYIAEGKYGNDLVRATLNPKKLEIETLAAKAGLTLIKETGSSYTTYTKGNIEQMQCAAQQVKFKADDVKIRVRSIFDVGPSEAIPDFVGMATDKGYLPVVSEMERTVCNSDVN